MRGNSQWELAVGTWVTNLSLCGNGFHFSVKVVSMLLRFIFLIFFLQACVTYAACEGIYNHQFKTLQGKTFDLCDYQSQPVLVVNTASKCGFTPQFEALEEIYEAYQDKGLLVIGFPSNDFKQELNENSKIGDFCKMTYGVKFPMMAKSHVTGSKANPFYQDLITQTSQAPMWNFYKYLILPNASEVYVFSSTVKPTSNQILGRIKAVLNQE